MDMHEAGNDWIGALMPIVLVLITLVATYYFKSRVRPVMLVNNEVLQQVDAQTLERRMRAENFTEFKMQALQNPFTLKFNCERSSLTSGLHMRVTRNRPHAPFRMLIAWSVHIDEFFNEIEQAVHRSFYDEAKLKFLNDCSAFVEQKLIDQNEEDMHVNVPDECLERFQASERANTTRTHYHVVVALFRRREELPLTSHNDIASNIYVLHLRDTKLASKVVSTYAKCLNNQIISISTIFASQDENMCVVCLSERSNQVLLPCSHNCICSSCLPRVQLKCPMCRSMFTNSFQIQ